jgi:hypothetical protein
VITGKTSPIDTEDDTSYTISASGMSVENGRLAEDALKPAFDGFVAAHNGAQPSDPSQLLPYVKSPAEQAALQKVLQSSAGK